VIPVFDTSSFPSEVVVFFNSPKDVKLDVNERVLRILNRVVGLADSYFGKGNPKVGIKKVTVKPYIPRETKLLAIEEEA
jgi:hypothetical protein